MTSLKASNGDGIMVNLGEPIVLAVAGDEPPYFSRAPVTVFQGPGAYHHISSQMAQAVTTDVTRVSAGYLQLRIQA